MVDRMKRERQSNRYKEKKFCEKLDKGLAFQILEIDFYTLERSWVIDIE